MNENLLILGAGQYGSGMDYCHIDCGAMVESGALVETGRKIEVQSGIMHRNIEEYSLIY